MNDSDPVKPAADWLAANPDHECARYVRAALESAARHEALALAAVEAPPGGTYVVVITNGKATPIFTATGRVNEMEIARAYMRWWLPLERRRVEAAAGDADALLEMAHAAMDHCDRRLDAINRMIEEVGHE